MSEWAQHVVIYCAGVAVGFVIGECVAILLSGCYDAHAAEPCDAGEDLSCEAGQCDGARTYGESQESEEAGSNPATGHRTYPGPCPFAYDHAHCWCVDATHEVCGAPCAGPIVASECYANLEDWLSR